MSNDTIAAVLKTFTDYSNDFGKLEPDLMPKYFHLPAMLMTSGEVALMTENSSVIGVFTQLFAQLEHAGFKESKLNSLQISLVSEKQSIVSGVATRYKQNDSILEHFGLTYTLRRTDNSWKIIVGVLHDPNEFSASVPL
ncbi:MAG TPA: hypothetical protein VIJ25_02190 [Methylococcales bacterium]